LDKQIIFGKHFSDKATITVVVLTYNSEIKKVCDTLDSVIKQCDIDFNIIVSDDGSENFNKDKIETYFEQKCFYKYKLILNSINLGTLANVYGSISETDSIYIKLLGPGDLLIGSDCLRLWIDKMTKSKRKWSFCDPIFYTNMDGVKKTVSVKAHPQMLSAYLRDDMKKATWHYIALDDLPVGAAIIFERKMYLYYVQMALGKVKYAEDFLFRMIIYEGIYPIFTEEKLVLYEYGRGISTVNDSKWKKKIIEDRQAVDELILSQCNASDAFHYKICKVLKRKYNKNIFLNIMFKITEYGRVGQALKFRIYPRMTAVKEIID